MNELDETLCSTLPEETALELTCWRCLKQPVYFRQARSFFAYAGGLRELIHRYKYQQHFPSGCALKTIFSEACATLSWDFQEYTWAIPVPMSKKRLHKRGFNQAWTLLESISEIRTHKKKPLLLQRSEETRPQSLLTAQERFENMSEVISLHPAYRESIAGQSILIVDDLFTTGATAQACAKVLCEAGAKHVDILTLCRGIL